MYICYYLYRFRHDLSETEIPEMNLTVSLVGGFDGFEGILVATLNGVNGTVCASDFDEGAAMAACKMIFPDTWVTEMRYL